MKDSWQSILRLLSKLSYFRGAWNLLFQLALGTLLVSLVSLGAPLFTQILFDRVLAFQQKELLPSMLVGLVLLAVSQSTLQAVKTHLSNYLGLSLEYKLNLTYLCHLLHLPLATHRRFPVGDLLSRFRDLSTARVTLTEVLTGVPSTLLILFFSLALVFTYSTSLGLLTLLNIPVQMVYGLIVAPRIKRNSHGMLKKSAEVQSFLIHALRGLVTLKSLGAERWALYSGKRHVAENADITFQYIGLANTSNAVFTLLASFCGLLLLWYGAGLVLEQQLTVGQLIAAYGLSVNAATAISALSGNLASLYEGAVASERLDQILMLPDEQLQEGHPEILAPLSSTFEARDIRFSYSPGREVLTKASFTLTRGTCTALVGANGVGKSTLGMILAGLIEPEGGEILWDGVSLKGMSPQTIRRRVAYMAAEVPVFWSTLRENLLLGNPVPESTLHRVVSELGMERILAKLPQGLDTELGGESSPHFSSGELQLIGVARMLLCEADLLILDEPTSALDFEREAMVVGSLRSLSGKRTLLVITHRPALLKIADQTIELKDGETHVYQSI